MTALTVNCLLNDLGFKGCHGGYEKHRAPVNPANSAAKGVSCCPRFMFLWSCKTLNSNSFILIYM